MGTLHRLPAKGKSELEEALASVVRALRRGVDDKAGPNASFEQTERAALELSNEATRRFLEESLQEIADSHCEQVKIRGWRYRRHQPGTVAYHSLCCVVVPRSI